MRNRAKCKVCNEIIESTETDKTVWCKCKQIGINGGKEKFWCHAVNFENFLRIDDEDNEIPVHFVDMTNQINKAKLKQVLESIDEMVKSYEGLPATAMLTEVTHYDLMSVLYLLSSFSSCWASFCKEDN